MASSSLTEIKHLSEIKELPSTWLDLFESMERSLPQSDTALRPKLSLLCRHLGFARRVLDMLVHLEGDLPERFDQLQLDVEKISAASHGLGSDSLLPMVSSLLQELNKVNGLLSLQASAFSDAYPYRREATVNPIFDIRHDPFADVYKDNDPYLDSCASADFLQLFEDLDNRGKNFLMCFAVFPANTVVDKRTLTYWCMGMGVLHPSENQVERVADRILEELVMKGFVEAEKQNFKLVGFKLCPLVRCFVVKVAKRLDFYAFDEEGAPSFDRPEPSRVFLSRVGTKSSLDKLLATNDEQLQKVQCVFNVNDPYPDFDLLHFEKMKNLSALCLGRSSSDQHIEIKSLDFLKGLKVAKNLTILSLRGVSQVFWLPDALCKHANLRVLDLNSCHNLELLPEEIGLLVNLTNLDISKCYLLERMPKGLASLTKLRILKGFLVVEDEASCAFANLAGLKKLNKLSIYVNKMDFPSKDEQRVLREFPLLRDFSIHWGGRAVTKKPKVDEPSAVQEEEASSGLGGGGSNITLPSTSEIGSGDKSGDISPSRNEGMVTNTTEILEGVRDTASEVPNDDRVATGGRNTDQSLSKGLGEPSKAGATSKTPVKKVLSRIPTLLIRKDLDRKTKEPSAMLEAVDKLVLQCFPLEEAPSWLVPRNLPRLKQLHIKGGRLCGFSEAWREGASKLEMLRLNYLTEFQMAEEDLRTYFPKLNRLAKAECPKLSGFPADGCDIWIPPRGGGP